MRSIILFAFSAAVILVTLKLIGMATEPPGDLEQRMVKFDQISGREAVSLGSSVGHAIRFGPMCIDGTEYTASEQDIFEIGAFADAMLSLPEPPRLWLVGVAPPSQSQDNGSRAEYRTDWRRKQAYRILWARDHRALIDNDWRGLVSAFVAPPLGWNQWRPRIDQMIDGAVGRKTRPMAQFQPWADERIIDDEEDRATAIAFAENQASRLIAARYYDSAIAERSQSILSDMNKKIRAQGGSMVIVVPPMTKRVNEQAKRLFASDIKQFRQMLAGLEREGVAIFWHWDDPEYYRNLTLFRDNVHLNKPGVIRFSRDIGEQLRAAGLVTSPDCVTD